MRSLFGSTPREDRPDFTQLLVQGGTQGQEALGLG